jgi:hypothetical protein
MFDVSADCVGPRLPKMSQRKKSLNALYSSKGCPFRFSDGSSKA